MFELILALGLSMMIGATLGGIWFRWNNPRAKSNWSRWQIESVLKK